jgi:hypothetical protein
VNTSEPHKAQVRTSGRVLKPHKIHGTPANRLEVITLQAERVALRKGMIDLRLAELREGRLTIASQGRAPTAYSATQWPA